MGLGPAVELPLSARPVLGRADQGCLQPVFDEPLADPLDGGGTNVEGLGDLFVIPSGSLGGGIGLEQDAGMGQLLSGGLAGGDEFEQTLTFLGGLGHDVLLH